MSGRDRFMIERLKLGADKPGNRSAHERDNLQAMGRDRKVIPKETSDIKVERKVRLGFCEPLHVRKIGVNIVHVEGTKTSIVQRPLDRRGPDLSHLVNQDLNGVSPGNSVRGSCPSVEAH